MGGCKRGSMIMCTGFFVVCLILKCCIQQCGYSSSQCKLMCCIQRNIQCANCRLLYITFPYSTWPHVVHPTAHPRHVQRMCIESMSCPTIRCSHMKVSCCLWTSSFFVPTGHAIHMELSEHYCISGWGLRRFFFNMALTHVEKPVF